MKPGVLALALLASLLAVAHVASGDGAPVKLCGRDFVRAIVFTCGGSRWRRHADDYADAMAESNEASPSARRSDGSAAEGPERGEQDGAGRAGRAPAPRRREAAKLLPTACCSVGCSEKDISALC